MPKITTWQPSMSIIVIGINHNTAPIEVREKVYFAQDVLHLYLQDLLNRGYAEEAVIISTCNRSELYCHSENIYELREWFCEQTAVSRHILLPLLYIYQDQVAVEHITRVACGLDSMVLGESQILGQLKDAFSESCTAGTVGSLFHRLFQQIFTVAKDIRTTTAIGACPVSVASASVHFTRQQIPNFDQANVVLIGAGDTTELLLRYLKTYLSKPITLVNRNAAKASTLADEFGARAYGLEQLATALVRADVVFSATGSPVPILHKPLLAEAMQGRKQKPITLVDIAVPRDIDPDVRELENVSLFCIDDLKAIIEKNRHGREHAADKAREMIAKMSMRFISEMKSHDKVTHTIRAYRGQIEEISRAELAKAKLLLNQGEDPIHVLDLFAQAFTKKLLHAPSVQLRQAGVEGRFELLKFAKQLFSLPDPEIERL